ncbi:MAG: T9SS type A sorting domain-containing protein [Lewinellaceae bacterium]|nr:T9SS type A sorting domain-containing protein [Lewinellaceae bacterium]
MKHIAKIFLVSTMLLCSFSQTALLAQWSLVNSPFPGWIHDIKAFAGGYVCATYQGLYRSMDNAQTWQYFVPQGLVQDGVREIEVEGATVLLQTQNNRLFFSSDSGFSFQEIETSSFPKPLQIYEICLVDQYVYLVTPTVLYRTSNLGAQWETVSGQVRNLRQIDGKLFESSIKKIRVSTNEGASWSDLIVTNKEIEDYFVSGDTILLIERNQLYTRRSINGGQTWQQNALPVSYNSNFDYFIRFNQRIFLDVGNDILASDNLGATWFNIGNNQSYTTTRSLFADNQIILRGSDYGIYRSLNGIMPFELSSAGLKAGFPNTLRSINGNLYAASEKGLYKLSTDEEHWENMQLGTTDSLFPYNDIIYSIGRLVVGHLYSDDNGQTWTSNTSLHTYRRFDMANGWMMSYGDGQCYYSNSTGQTWESADLWFTVYGGGDYAMSFNCVSDTVWGIGSAKRVMHSENGGQAWMPFGDSLSFHMYDYPWFSHITKLDDRLAMEGFSDSTGHNLWVSDDEGISWKSIPPPSENGIIQHSIYHNGIWITACSPGGVQISTDKGDSWTPLNVGLLVNDISFIAIHKGELWVTGGSGTYKRPLNDLVLSTSNIEKPTGLNISPNPAISMIQVKCDGAKGRLQIFDNSGKSVYSNHGFRDSTIIDVQQFPSGIYKVILSDGSRILEENIVVIK